MTGGDGPATTRRRLLAATGLAVAAAGCSGGEGAGTTTTETDRTTDAAATADGSGGAAGLDLREANVTGVAAEADGDGVRFDVTLYHDDDGEGGYANWWQVERLDGTRLGRRDLLHAHGTREFTRSATVSVPSGVDCVVVRGHDETHGYGGRAALVGVESGAVRIVEQGPEPDAFEASDCP